MKEIFIPFNTPSLKNSKVKTARGIFPSPTVTKYLRKLGIQSFSSSRKTVKEYVDPDRPNIFREILDKSFPVLTEKDYPLVLKFHFVRDTKRKFDFNNANQIICDLLVAHGYIEDDNMSYLIPMPVKRKGKWYTINKDTPGVFLKF